MGRVLANCSIHQGVDFQLYLQTELSCPVSVEFLSLAANEIVQCTLYTEQINYTTT